MEIKDGKRIYETPISLTDIIRGFMEHATQKGEPYFPHFDSRAWHNLLYITCKWQTLPLIAKAIGGFDYDGPYPKCKGLPDTISGMRFVCRQRFIAPHTVIELVPAYRNPEKYSFRGITENIISVAHRIDFFKM